MIRFRSLAYYRDYEEQVLAAQQQLESRHDFIVRLLIERDNVNGERGSSNGYVDVEIPFKRDHSFGFPFT